MPRENARLLEIREDEKQINQIADRAQRFLNEENHIVITHAAAIPTIAYVFLRETIIFLNENKVVGTDIEVNLMQILDIGISHHENDKAKKEGNFTPYARPGQEFKLLVKEDAETANSEKNLLLLSTFDHYSLLSKYDLKSIDDSVIKYYQAIQLWINELMDIQNYFEEMRSNIIQEFEIIGHSLCRKEDNPYFTDEENLLFKNRQLYLKKYFALGFTNVRTKLLSFKKQADNLERRIEEINNSDNAINELAILEREERATFKFIAENTVTIMKNALSKIEYFEKNRAFAINIINLESKWTENYKMLKTMMKEELKNTCEDDKIEEELWSEWYEDWRRKRLIIEKCFLPLVENALKGNLIKNNPKSTDSKIASAVPVIEGVIEMLEQYKKDIDRFYIAERKNIYQKYDLEVGGDLLEKFQVEFELYKVTSGFQKKLLDIIFKLEKAEDKIFLLEWAKSLMDIQIDEILDFVKDKDLNKISKKVLEEFNDLKIKNYETYISDTKAYSEEQANREKHYNSLMFKMRKELMK